MMYKLSINIFIFFNQCFLVLNIQLNLKRLTQQVIAAICLRLDQIVCTICQTTNGDFTISLCFQIRFHFGEHLTCIGTFKTNRATRSYAIIVLLIKVKQNAIQWSTICLVCALQDFNREAIHNSLIFDFTGTVITRDNISININGIGVLQINRIGVTVGIQLCIVSQLRTILNGKRVILAIVRKCFQCVLRKFNGVTLALSRIRIRIICNFKTSCYTSVIMCINLYRIFNNLKIRRRIFYFKNERLFCINLRRCSYQFLRNSNGNNIGDFIAHIVVRRFNIVVFSVLLVTISNLLFNIRASIFHFIS